MNLSLYYPVKDPINQNNLFGTPSPLYASLGQKGHPGLDFECPMFTPIYAPCDGEAFYTYDQYGGDGIWIRVPNNATPSYDIILWHMPPKTDTAHWIISTEQSVVTPVKAGQLIGYSGNSGYPLESTGAHLHLAVVPCDATGSSANPNNGYKGCVDPMPFFNGHYAQNISVMEGIISTMTTLVKNITSSPDASPAQKLTWLQEIADAIKTLHF